MQAEHRVKTNSICVNCFKALSVPSRMEIYKFIRDHKKATVTAVTDFVKLTQPTISYHLKEMKGNGLLKSQKVHKEVYYEINPMCPHYKVECILNGVEFPKSMNKSVKE